MMENNEESTTTDKFSTDSTTETAWIPKQMNMDVLIEQFLAWKNRTNKENIEERTSENIFTGDEFTDSTFSERISHNGEVESKEDVLITTTEMASIPKKMNMDVMIETFLAWKNSTKEQFNEKSTLVENNEESTSENISTEDTDSTSSDGISHNGELEPKEDVLTYILNKYYSLNKDGLIKSDTTKTGSVKASLNSVMESYKNWKESENRT